MQTIDWLTHIVSRSLFRWMDHVANTKITNVNGPNKIDLDFDGVTKTHENIVLCNNEENVSENWGYKVYALKISFDLGNDLCIPSAHIKSD